MTITAKSMTNISRRGLLAGAGGLSFCLALGADGGQLIASANAKVAGHAQSPWVRISPDGVITIYSAGAEMGQGSLTSLPLILAEEMDADWSKVAVEFAPADKEIYGYTNRRGKSMGIVGSRAVRNYYTQLRLAGAQVRKVLLAKAAKKMGVDVASLKTEPSVVIHAASGRRLTYGELAADGVVPTTLPKVTKSELKKESDFRLIGKSVARVDIPAKVNGTATFAMDIQRPGMVYASTIHSPVQGGKPVSWNDAELKALPGITDVVKLKTGVAIVGKTWQQVVDARFEFKGKWKSEKAKGFNSENALAADYEKIFADPGAKVNSLDKKGDFKTALSGSAKRFKSEYRSDLGYHAQMEPLNATAQFNAAGDRVEVWDGSQSPDRCRTAIAKALGFKEEQVTHTQCYMGGGFGRRSLGDYAVEAALVAKAVGRPVKLIWTREEDIAYGMFRPQSFHCLEAGMDASGKVVGWGHCVVGDGRRLLNSGIKIGYYKIPNQSIERRGVSHGIRLKHWRSVGHVFNVFSNESFIDEMASSEGVDPIDFRLQRMSITSKGRAVFEKVAAMSDWKRKRPAGHALGVSISERSGSLGAGVVEISLDRKTGQIKVHKVWLAVDGGVVVQPAAAKANLESGIIYGLSSVLKERATMQDGTVEQSNFNDYHVLRMSEAPEELHVDFVDSKTKPTGLGEIGNPFIGAAVANAFHKLTGKRLRHMPFTPDRVLEALKA